MIGPIPANEVKIVSKSWGFERWFHNEDYCGKELFFFSGASCSWHYHREKTETFVVVAGQFEIRHNHPSHDWGGEFPMGEQWWEDWQFKNFEWVREDLYRNARIAILNPGDAFHVPVGMIHQMKAIGGDSRLFEFSTHHKDEDSFRLIKGD